MKLIVLVVLVVSFAAGERFMYPGYKVYNLQGKNVEDAYFLHDLMLSENDFDFWSEPNMAGTATVMIPPEHQERFLHMMEERNIEVSIHTSSVETVLQQLWTSVDSRTNTRDPANFDFDDFNTFEEIIEWLDYTVNDPNGLCFSHSNLQCELVEFGRSYENRPLVSLRITTVSDLTTHRPSFWVDGTIHAREWLVPATVLKIMNKILTDYSTDNEVQHLLDNYDWYFVPVFNPDGYIYSWTTQRLWRKNRRPSDVTPGCIGTDLNRNHEVNWGMVGVSHDPCNSLYCGDSAASEPEVQAVQDEIEYVNSLNGIQVLMTFHAYGYQWMHPWGHTYDFIEKKDGGICVFADDHDDMFRVADATADAIQNVHNTRWDRGTSCDVIYETTGGTDDWAKGVLDIKYTICPELRGRDFVINKIEIPRSFSEIWAGLVAQEKALVEV